MPEPFGNDSDLRARILAYVRDRALPRIVQLTHPIFALDSRDLPQLIGSAVVVAIGPSRLLITASHVLRRWPGAAVATANELRPIRGRWSTLYTAGAESGSADDKADVSVVRLDDQLAGTFAPQAVVGFADIDYWLPDPDQDQYIISGYPERANRDGLDGKEFAARAYSLIVHDGDRSLYEAIGADPAWQLAAPFEPRDVWDADGQRTAPDLQGVSGGGVWRILTARSPTSKTRLSAVAVEQHRKGQNRHVLATRISAVLSLVYDQHEDLRGAIEAGLPNEAA